MDRQLLDICQADYGKFNEAEFKRVMQDESLKNVDLPDKHGMTPLMHCAYYGLKEPCQQLLAKGADVNNHDQRDGYSALMFAAVAGRLEVVRLLLEAGARPGTLNNLGKTALAMAAFAGQHEAVQIILNFFPLDVLDEFTKFNEQLGRPRLSPSLAPSVYFLLTTIHVHPVMILKKLQAEPALLECILDVKAVFYIISERLVEEGTEGLALKLHYLSFLMDLAKKHGPDAVIAKMLTFSDQGKAVEMDKLLRQCLREFTHPQLPMVHQIIATLAKITPGENPTAYALILSVVLGDKGAASIPDGCFTCGIIDEDRVRRCSRCRQVSYCSTECQRLAWTKGNHNVLCKRWATIAAARAVAAALSGARPHQLHGPHGH